MAKVNHGWNGWPSVGFDTLQAIAEGLNCTVEIVPRQTAKYNENENENEKAESGGGH